MPKAKNAVARHKRVKKIFKQAKGNFGGRSKLYRTAKETVLKGGTHAYVGRKQKKRDFRKLWIVRIKAAANQRDISYSKFQYGLKKANITLNRKALSELAIHSPSVFDELVEIAKKQIA